MYVSLNSALILKRLVNGFSTSTNPIAATLKMLVGCGKVSILVQTIVLLSVSSKCHVPKAMPELLITNS